MIAFLAFASAAVAPVSQAPLASYFGAADMSFIVGKYGKRGRVGFDLKVDAIGRVAGCTITRSGGDPMLDGATCRILVRRARFRPAKDLEGNPAEGTVSGEIEWKMP
jgi:protein TonB